jgi:SAM-dependent methyltransferase
MPNLSANATRSGDYVLAGRLSQRVGNAVLRAANFVPLALGQWFVTRRGGYYQVTGTDVAGSQGISDKKWEAMQMPADLRGKSVLDIGCSEGFFAQHCAERGAGPVVGVDNSLGRLLISTFRSRQAGLKVEHRMGTFPGPQARGTFDYVLCLSVLHHAMRKKDLWKVLTEEAHGEDLAILRGLLRELRGLTAAGGNCIVEMPYEYDDPDVERRSVDFEMFGRELVAAGFGAVRCLGGWEYNPDHVRYKDRIIYAAVA